MIWLASIISTTIPSSYVDAIYNFKLALTIFIASNKMKENAKEKINFSVNMSCIFAKKNAIKCVSSQYHNKNLLEPKSSCRKVHVWVKTFPMRGLSIRQMDVCDNRNVKLVDEITHYDALIPAGGHVPTQNKFFKKVV